MLTITPEVRDQMFAHALAGLPNEACGMFSAHEGIELVDVFHPMRNAAESAMIFTLDPKQMLEVEAEADRSGRILKGVMHSHTHTSPYPSPTDIADIGRFDPFGSFSHVIVSLRDAEPVLRSFRIAGGVVTEEPVVVDEPEPIVHDQAGAVAAVTRLPRRSGRS